MIRLWARLQRREQITVLAGGLLVLLTAIYLLFAGLWETRAELLGQQTDLLEERAWLEEQSQLAMQLSNSCRENQILALGGRELVELLASRNQLRLETVNINGADFSLRLSAENGDNVLRFIYQSACQGFALSGLQIDRTDTDSYLGRLEFRREG